MTEAPEMDSVHDLTPTGYLGVTAIIDLEGMIVAALPCKPDALKLAVHAISSAREIGDLMLEPAPGSAITHGNIEECLSEWKLSPERC